LKSKNTIENFEEEKKSYLKEINNLNKIIMTNEDQSLRVSEVEKKIKVQKIIFDRKIKELENFYKERISILNKNPFRDNSNTSKISYIKDNEKYNKTEYQKNNKVKLNVRKFTKNLIFNISFIINNKQFYILF
jgi:hypothetical protein